MDLRSVYTIGYMRLQSIWMFPTYTKGILLNIIIKEKGYLQFDDKKIQFS